MILKTRLFLICVNIAMLVTEIGLMFLIKYNLIKSNYALEIFYNVICYGAIIGLQALLLFLTTQMKNTRNKNNLLLAQLIIFPAIFILILFDMNVV